MNSFTLVAVCAFGLESVLADELRGLGYADLKKADGRVFFKGNERDIARCNLWLRTADRVQILMAEFDAPDFGALFDGACAVEWERFIPENGRMHVEARSVKSKLSSLPACQSVVKKAVVQAMSRKYGRDRFEEDGPLFSIELSLSSDRAFITLDTSGDGLHKRGYRKAKGEAPLRETLAAALVILSRWDISRPFADPLCGSGTIPIEACLIGANIAPGLGRSFSAEQWPFIAKSVWYETREEARSSIRGGDFNVYASDIDTAVFRKARENAAAAGVAGHIVFERKKLEEFSSRKPYGCLVCNPPYGERIGGSEEVTALYREMGRVLGSLDSWSVFVLTAHPDFEKYYGRRADKNRKLYNGKIKCYLYQYFGPLPRKSSPPRGERVDFDTIA
ncbi:MAG: class I SAM-dependent RNA methyltransferase [Spirochaetes bacterium]|jgi:putative N6-adenine-specific DNA methylase|nr:class I SAM-dependent RNA methyltransferase [Spirochaetota bacterium]